MSHKNGPPEWLQKEVEKLLAAHGVSHETGFLIEPERNAVQSFGDPLYAAFSAVIEMAARLPKVIKLPALHPDTGSPIGEWPRQNVREEIRAALAESRYDFDPKEVFGRVKNDPKAQADALYVLRDYRFLAQAYLHTPGQEPVDSLPAFLAVPIYKISQALDMSPQAGYTDVVSTNAIVPSPEEIVQRGPRIANPYRTFTPYDAASDRHDEKWFYHLHQMIEINAIQSILGVGAVVITMEQKSKVHPRDRDLFIGNSLDMLATGIGNLKFPMGKMRGFGEEFSSRGENISGMRKGFFLDVLRPFLKGTLDRGINYEGTPLADVREPGGSAAETALFPLWDGILGVKHERPSSKHITEVSRPFHPPLHRKLVDRAASRAGDLRKSCKTMWLREKFDDAVEALFHLRMAHTTLALSFLPEGVPGLGGAKDVRQFFSEMLEDTRDAMFDRARAAKLNNPFKSFAKDAIKPGGLPGGS